MRIFRSDAAPKQVADARTFGGRAETQLLASDDRPPVPAKVFHVRFDDGSRTNWHAHTGPQWLLIVAGRCRIQIWGEPAEDVEAGDAVMIEPGEKHWHGASPGQTGVHLAVNLNVETTWFEPVTDAQYRGA
jgi:quercetin dioxygenase-like cupin family protein